MKTVLRLESKYFSDQIFIFTVFLISKQSIFILDVIIIMVNIQKLKVDCD